MGLWRATLTQTTTFPSQRLCSHIIMGNAFSPTSKDPIVFKNPNPKTETQQDSNPLPLCLMAKYLDSSFLRALLIVSHFSLLGWFHSLAAAFLGRNPMTLASPIFWGVQCNTAFALTTPNNDLSRPPCKDSLAACLASMAFLMDVGRVHHAFIHLSFLVKPEPQGQNCQDILLA